MFLLWFYFALSDGAGLPARVGATARHRLGHVARNQLIINGAFQN